MFTHAVPLNVPLIYKWIRDTGVGELTPAQGGFYRVFFQSHIYLIIGWIYVMIALLKEKAHMRRWLLWGFSSFVVSALIMSLSRSFALGLVSAAGGMLFVSLVFWRFTMRETLHSAALMIASVFGGVLIVLAITFQAVINLGVVTKLLPTKGIALPLISAGGSHLFLTAAAVGILVSIARRSQILKSKVKD